MAKYYRILLLFIPNQKFFLFLGIVLFSFLPSVATEIEWSTSLEESLTKAKEQNKPVLIDVYTDWCGYCKVLEGKIFPDPKVVGELSNFITVRLNGDENPELVEKYKISGYPTILFLDKNGSFLDKLVGLPDANYMKSKLVAVYAKRNLEEELLARQTEYPDNQETNYKLGVYYLKLLNFPKSIDYFLKTYNAKENIIPERKKESLYILGVLNIQEKKFSESASLWTLFMQEYPDGDLSVAFYYRAVSNFHLGNAKSAKEDFLKCKEIAKDENVKSSADSYLEKL